MPSLNRIGKEVVVEHHRQAPHHLLRRNNALPCGAPDASNLLGGRSILSRSGNSIENKREAG